MTTVDVLIAIPVIPLVPMFITWWLPWERWIPWGKLPKLVLGPYVLYAAFAAWHFHASAWFVLIVIVAGVVLTITGAVSVATSDHFQIRTMLWAALGCNLAWGIIDGGMYLMARLSERGRNSVVARAVHETSNREEAHRIIADELPPFLGSSFQPAQLEFIRERINQMPASDLRPGLTGRDWLGAFGVCILVVLSTFPVVIPFIVFGDARLALRTSNACAVVLLFICGFLFARHAGLWP